MSDWEQSSDDYRVRQDGDEWHAEMFYHCKGGEQWVPLNADGYWADPDCYSTGEVTKPCPMSAATDAHRAIWLAMKVNRS